MKTAMQDLKEDLELAIESANDALNDINNEFVRKQCQLVVKVTIGDILKRIDSELLEIEKNQIIDAVNSQRQIGWDEKGEAYYNETYKSE